LFKSALIRKAPDHPLRSAEPLVSEALRACSDQAPGKLA
jgi:hypothetical protein